MKIIAFFFSFLLLAYSNGFNQVKSKENIIDINTLKGKYTVKVGDKISYADHVHGSVGEEFEISISGDGLVLDDRYFEYYEEPEEGETGGDGGTRTYIYKATKAGTYEVKVSRFFRGETESSHTITVVVE